MVHVSADGRKRETVSRFRRSLASLAFVRLRVSSSQAPQSLALPPPFPCEGLAACWHEALRRKRQHTRSIATAKTKFHERIFPLGVQPSGRGASSRICMHSGIAAPAAMALMSLRLDTCMPYEEKDTYMTCVEWCITRHTPAMALMSLRLDTYQHKYTPVTAALFR